MRPDQLRELYGAGRPNQRARDLQRRLMPFARLGLVPFAAVLEVLGRRSGRVISLPVVVLRVHGADYLVSMLGREANWVRNVRAAHGEAVLHRGRRRRVRLVEVGPEEAAQVLHRYVRVARSGRVHLRVGPRSTRAELVAAAPDYPTFRIDPPRSSRPSAPSSRPSSAGATGAPSES